MFDSVTGTADLFRVLDLTGVVANALLGGAAAGFAGADAFSYTVGDVEGATSAAARPCIRNIERAER